MGHHVCGCFLASHFTPPSLCPLQYSIDMGLKKMFKNGDAKPAVRRRKGGKGGDAKEEDTDDEVENCSDKVMLVRLLVVNV